jgi:hypothetical protein
MLDPATVADLQPPIVARSKTNPPQSLSRAASVLAQCARLLSLPVHHSVVPEGGKAPEVLPDLAKETEGAPQFARMTADVFLADLMHAKHELKANFCETRSSVSARLSSAD